MTLKHCSSGVPASTNKATTIWNISCPLENTTSRTWDVNNEAAQSAATTTRSKQSMWCAVAHKVGWMAAKASMTTQMRFFFLQSHSSNTPFTYVDWQWSSMGASRTIIDIITKVLVGVKKNICKETSQPKAQMVLQLRFMLIILATMTTRHWNLMVCTCTFLFAPQGWTEWCVVILTLALITIPCRLLLTCVMMNKFYISLSLSASPTFSFLFFPVFTPLNFTEACSWEKLQFWSKS